jgi:BlaR1 peptidase M56
MADSVRARLRMKRFVRLRISETAASPFVCGLWHPVIVLPAGLLRGMGDTELCALLGHEMAHVRSHDLPWCVAWRWMQAVFWFHPPVWKIPAAHLLACEQEADRRAAALWESSDRYAQSLAQLILQVNRLPAVETALTLNASSQIARRLMYLKRAAAGPWKWFHSLGATALTGILAVIAAGWNVVEVAAASADPAAPLPIPIVAKAAVFREALLVLQDEAGVPISGAKLRADAFRVKGRLHGNAYSWRPQTSGKPPEVITDERGRALVTYPVDVIPEEKLELSDLTFSVSHPDFAPAQIDFAVDRGEAAPLKLVHGIQLEVSGYFGSNHQTVMELVPSITPGPHAEEGETWETLPNGKMVSRQIAPGSHLLQVMGRLSSGQIVFSESVEVTAETGKAYNFDLELKPGGRIEGRLDSSVPRPVKNGRVVLSVRPKQVSYRGGYSSDGTKLTDKFGYLSFWTSFRPLPADGTFVFESIPPGDIEIVACGDGFVSKNGSVSSDTRIGVPQLFSQTGPLTKIEVAAEPSAILIVMAKTANGAPVAGATITASPNMYQGFGTTIFGAAYGNSEAPFHTVESLPMPAYHAVTDQAGVAQIPNLPSRTYSFEVFHPDLELALQQSPSGRPYRSPKVNLTPGRSTSVDITLQPRGNQFLGEATRP